MTAFDEATAVTRSNDDVFEGHIAPGWMVVRGPHGGYITSIILRALTERLADPGRAIRSFTTHFVAAPTEGDVTVHTTIERSGGTMSFLSARMEQDGKVMATSLAVFSTPWEGFSFDDTVMPDVVSPENALKIPDDDPNVPQFLRNFDMRFCIGQPPLFQGADEALLGGWYRLRDPQTVDAIVAATLLDAWAPPPMPRATEMIICPTIDLTMHFRTALPLDGAAPGDFYLGRFSSTLARDGFFEEDGVLWAADGTLIANSRQLALAFYPRKVRTDQATAESDT